VEETCTEDLLGAFPSIQGIYLSGSLARGDWAPGYSDIDLIAVGENVEGDEVCELRELVQKVVGDVEVSVSAKNVVDLGKGKVEAFILALDSVLLAGEDLLGKPETPDQSCIKEYGKRVLKRQVEDWIRHTEEKRTPGVGEDASGSVYMVLKLAQSALLSKGLVCLGAGEILARFAEEFGREELFSYVREACELRSRWETARADKERIEGFSNRAVRFAHLLSRRLGMRLRRGVEARIEKEGRGSTPSGSS